MDLNPYTFRIININIMKHLAILLALIISPMVMAQEDVPAYNFYDSEKILKVDFSNVFSSIPTVGLDLETKVHEELSLQFGAAIIPSYLQPWVGNRQNDFDHLRGYRLRGEGRFYVLKKPTRYIASELAFRHLIIRQYDVPVGMEPLDNPSGVDDFAYFVNTDMRFHQFNASFTLKYGIQKNLGQHFVYDVNVGMRINKINVQSNSELPEGGILPIDWNNNLTLIDNYRRSNIRPTFEFKLGYKL